MPSEKAKRLTRKGCASSGDRGATLTRLDPGRLPQHKFVSVARPPRLARYLGAPLAAITPFGTAGNALVSEKDWRLAGDGGYCLVVLAVDTVGVKGGGDVGVALRPADVLAFSKDGGRCGPHLVFAQGLVTPQDAGVAGESGGQGRGAPSLG